MLISLGKKRRIEINPHDLPGGANHVRERDRISTGAAADINNLEPRVEDMAPIVHGRSGKGVV
jgi:hypothetical protein